MLEDVPRDTLDVAKTAIHVTAVIALAVVVVPTATFAAPISNNHARQNTVATRRAILNVRIRGVEIAVVEPVQINCKAKRKQ